MLVGKIQAQHRKELEDLENDFNEKKENMYDNEKQLLETNDMLARENSELKKALTEATGDLHKTKEHLAYITKNHEQEVKLRL